MASKQEIPALTGLRAIAALLVVISHFAYLCAPFSYASVPRIYQDAFNIAGFGMSLFFVLSGFVITYNYADYPWRPAPFSSFGRFLYLRLSRLYPALLLFFAMVFYRTTDTSARSLEVTILHLYSMQSWLPLAHQGTILGGSRFNISWSISTEIMMYLLFVVAMIAISRWPRAGLGAVLLSLASVFCLWFVHDEAAAYISAMPPILEPLSQGQAASWLFYISPWFRILDFAAGCFAAYVVLSGFVARLPRRLPSLLAAASGSFIVGFHIWRVVGVHGIYFVTVQLISTAAFFFIIVAAAQPSMLNRALSIRPLMFVGIVSYSLYLFHGLAPYFLGFNQVGAEPFSARAVIATVVNIIAATVAAIAIAAMVYALVERPGQRGMRWLMNYRTRSPRKI